MSEQAKESAAREADAAWEAVYEVLGRETAARLQRAVRATAAVVVARAMDKEALDPEPVRAPDDSPDVATAAMEMDERWKDLMGGLVSAGIQRAAPVANAIADFVEASIAAKLAERDSTEESHDRAHRASADPRGVDGLSY